MDQYLQGRVALVTGGFTGIGFAISQSLAQRGAKIAIASRTVNQQKLQTLRALSNSVFSESVDIRDTQAINDFIETVQSQLGAIDILINCAGISAHQLVEDHPDSLWNAVIETNLSAPFKLIRACLPAMKKQNWGRIINIGSTAARTARAQNAAYCASKTGLLGLTRAVALEGAAHAISCVMVSPTWVETPMMHASMGIAAQDNSTTTETEFSRLIQQSPQQRLVQPEELGALVSFLCRQEALAITMEDIQVNAACDW